MLKDKAQEVSEAIRDRVRLNSYYRDTFQSPQGQKVLRHLCKVAHVTTPTFVAGDPYATSFNEGQRHIVLSILRFVNRNPNEIVKQIEEQHHEESNII